MKKLYLIVAFLLLFIKVTDAQVTGFTPSQGALGQTLQTTITGNGIFLQNATPSGNLYQIKLIKGADVITLFDWNQFWNYYFTVTVAAELNIPIGGIPGVYDLEVITGDLFDPQLNQTTYTLPAAFTILTPDGYISGTVYDDLNKNGIKDGGEPGIIGRSVQLLPLNYTLITNTNGDYSFPASNGNYSVVLLNSTSNFKFVTSANDTIPVTVNNANVPGIDFGLKDALISINPDIGYRGITTTHQIISDEPIFHPGINPWGNVNQLRVMSSPSVTINTPSNFTVIDSFTVNVVITIPLGTNAATNLDLRIYLNSGFVGYHYLKQQFDILTPPSFISGNMFFDQNQNKINDVGEPGIEAAKLILTPENSIAFSNTAGDYLLASLGGQQTVSYDNNIPGLALFTDSVTYTFNATGNITGKDFGFISTAVDYSILVKNIYLFPRCNSAQYVSFKVRNVSNTAYDARVWLKYSPLMTYISSTIPPTSVVNDTIYWDIPNLIPYTEVTISAYMQLPGGGNTLPLTAGAVSIDVNGVSQLTNQLSQTYFVFCAMDPNDKQATPPGIFAQNFTLMSDTLDYLIRFQNTGNDTAFNVVVLDTLDAELDYNTFNVVGSSHSMQTELKSNGALRFNFENILLVDSVANEPESHGWIRYTIVPQTGLPDTTIINNTAHIYFDFNAAVVTNTTLNTLVYVLPVGINEVDDDAGVNIIPNPFNESAVLSFNNPAGNEFTFTVYGIAGNKIAPEQKTKGSQFNINRNKMADGIYFYQLVNNQTQKIITGKFIIN